MYVFSVSLDRRSIIIIIIVEDEKLDFRVKTAQGCFTIYLRVGGKVLIFNKLVEFL